MDFNSPLFLFLFLPVFMLAYHLSSGRMKIIVGIAGSLLFYAWGSSEYILLMVGLTVFTYLVAQGIDRWRTQALSRILFWFGIVATVGLLVAYKLGADAKYPLGLSYVTFQAISFLYEVYVQKVEAEQDFLKFSFYLLLFPKIPVGPIMRYSQMRDQIQDIHVTPTDIAEGIRRFILGFAKKALIADTLARVVIPIFKLDSPSIAPSIAWLVLLSYALQLYFDFSGFVDMAIGMGRMMGLRFVENFDFPYISKSISEFWRRWHISFSSWFRDLVFYPLERRRLKWIGQPLNILIVFTLTGLWHGFGLTYVIWGLIHGAALIFESTFLGRSLRKLWAPIQHIYALGVIMIGWLFFRSPSVQFAFQYLKRLAGSQSGVHPVGFAQTAPLPFIEPTFVLALAAAILFSLPIGSWFGRIMENVRFRGLYVALSAQIIGDLVLLVMFIASIAAMTANTSSPGIYGTF